MLETGNCIPKLRYTRYHRKGGERERESKRDTHTNNFARQRFIDYTIFAEQSFSLYVRLRVRNRSRGKDVKMSNDRFIRKRVREKRLNRDLTAFELKPEVEAVQLSALKRSFHLPVPSLFGKRAATRKGLRSN